MTEAVKLIVDFAFHELKLHRIEAGVMPRNLGSMRVLEKAGFHKEGIARKNVKINGVWEDHQVLAILNPDDEHKRSRAIPGFVLTNRHWRNFFQRLFEITF